MSPKASFNAQGKANLPADGSYAPTALTATGALVYDSSQISASQLPKTWAQLLSPKYKNMLGMNDPTQSGPTISAIQSHTIKMAIIQSSAGYGQELTTLPSLHVAYLNPVTALPSVIGIDAYQTPAVRAEAQKFVDYVFSKAGQHVTQTGDPQGDSLFWPVLNGEKPTNKIIPALSTVPMQNINPNVWGPLETTINTWFTSNINNG